MDLAVTHCVDILSIVLSHMQLKNDQTKILDCCAGDATLSMNLMEHFVEVHTNDLNSESKSQTHFDITDMEFWRYIHKAYDGIITQPPSNLMEIVILRAIAHCKSFCAVLLTPQKLISLNSLLMHNPANVTVFMGSELVWAIWDLENPSRNAVIEILNEDFDLNEKYTSNYTLKVEEKIKYAINPSQMTSQHELLYLKGVHAAKQGKALERTIDKYKGMYSKRDVITKVCKMKYRSAQRKLRIAKYIEKFPEISSMTQRQAEKYISDQLKKQRS